tara:strand:+ start:65 stop:274 length:210 start_codon:yes stop_codon:yes gene_type:complete
MSGDNLHHPQNPKFYTDQGRRTLEQHSLCDASLAMDEIKEARWMNTNYILEIESMFVNARYRTGSVMQE